MANARAEQIIAAIKATLSVPGLATTGTNVHRGRAYPFQESELPALLVYQGPDELVNELESSYLDWDLIISIEVYVQTVAEAVDTVLNRIRKEVHIAIMADYQQGLSAFVMETTPLAVQEPVLNSEGDKPVATQRLDYVIRYRTSRTDISA